MWSDPDENWKNKNQYEIFSLVIVTSNKIYIYNFAKDLNVLKISTEN